VLEGTKLGWKEISIAYIFAILRDNKIAKGSEKIIHMEVKSSFDFVCNYLAEFGVFPTALHIKENFNFDEYYQGLQHIPSPELLKRLRTEYVIYQSDFLKTEIQKVITTKTQNLESELVKAIDMFNTSLFSTDNNEVARLSQFPEILHYFHENKQGEIIAKYGIEGFDNITGGIYLGDFIVLYANTGQGKSTLARHIAGNIARQGKKVLYFTLEEPAKKSVIKALSTQIQTSAKSLYEHTYTETPYDKMKKLTGQLVSGDVIFITRLESGSIAEISRYVHQYQPDIIVVDQISHLVKSSRGALWEAYTQKSSELRAYSQSTGIPMIALAQANRSGMKKSATNVEDSMAMAYAMAQDSSHCIFLHPDETDFQKKCTFVKNRDGEAGVEVHLTWKIAHGVIDTLHHYQPHLAFGGNNVTQTPNPLPNHTIAQPIPGTYQQTMGSSTFKQSWL
jgi:archaellum biogenesis ATPase FlaH